MASTTTSAALRKFADLLDANPDVLPPDDIEATFHLYGKEQRSEAAAIRRALGGEWRKDGSGNYFWLTNKLGPIKLTIFADRDQVCTRRVVGTETVTVPAVEAQPERTETREIVEWDCEPVTRDAEAVSSR